MGNTKVDLMKKSFEKYGKIEKAKETKKEIYFFECNLKKLTGIDIEKSLVYLVAFEENIVKLFLFSFETPKGEEEREKVLATVNQVNIDTKYGKFVLDNDGDVNWEYSYEQGDEIEDIKPYLMSCINGAVRIVKALWEK